MIETDSPQAGPGTPTEGEGGPVGIVEHHVPEEWQVVQLGTVADVRPSSVNKKTVAGEVPVRLCNYVDVYSNHQITPPLPFMEATATPAEIDKFGLQDGDVIITKDSETPDDIGVPAVVQDLGGFLLVCGYHLTLLRPTGAVDGRYLARYLSLPSGNAHFRRLAQGTTRYGLTVETVASAPVTKPPLPEQRRIAEILDTVDQAIRHTEAIIAKLEQVKAGLLHDLLTRGLDENGELRDPERHPEQFKDSPLGRIPTSWELARLEELLESAVDGPFGSNLKTEHYVLEPGVRVVRLQNLASGVFLDEDRAYVSAEHAASLRRHEVRPGDVLVASLGDDSHPPGRACLYPIDQEPGIVKADCFRLRADAAALNPYLMLALNSAAGRRELNSLSQGVTRDRVNLSLLRSVRLMVPPVEEQERIAEAELETDRIISSEGSVHAKLQLLKQGLAQDLLTGRIRVPATEPVHAAS